MSTARAWWSARSKWKWLALLVVLYVAISVPVKALTAHHPAAASIGPITAAMTSQPSTFWQRLGSRQRVELAAVCRSQLAAKARTPTGAYYSTAQVLSFTVAERTVRRHRARDRAYRTNLVLLEDQYGDDDGE
jgi:hypothetical protein